jgi:predicted GNAT family N-acyltransferase
MSIQIISTESKLYQKAIDLRNEILRKPLGMDIDNDGFKDGEDHVHFVALEDDEVVGVVVLIPHWKEGVGKLRQMATAEKVRGKGYGIQLVKALEEYAAEQQMTSVFLHSRHYAAGFYEKLGYTIWSDVFQEVGMDHFAMQKRI